ncbi:MAG: hypothetical protein IPM37_12330 [Hahellaceae bacterium]|nr:hypothetical protein [Hahellaceae bacterium]
MKVWQSYGSEHSANLVMIGRFKEESEAGEVKELLDFLFAKLPDLVDFDVNEDRYNSEAAKLLQSKNIYYLSPTELIQFRYEISYTQSGNEIRFTTDEDDVSGLLKLMLHNGAKLEVFSAHNYPEPKSSK